MINYTKNKDIEIRNLIKEETHRQKSQIQLIASENFVSDDVLYAQGSILTNKYAEGYPKNRYYSGCDIVDQIEQIAIERAKKLFNARYVNVQPHSGSQANQAIFLALLNPGDTILGMSLESGGHLTHGSHVNLSGKWFKSHAYNVNKETMCIDYDEVESIAKQCNPKLIITGYSAYNKSIDFKKFKQIADTVGALLLADISHIAGIIAAQYHQNPLPYADIVSSTTHKTLRGPRGGIIMTNNEQIATKVNKALFPGTQGGPLMHIVAAKATGFYEALQPSFKEYIKNVLLSAQSLSIILQKSGFKTLGNTENHLVLLDLRDKNITGKEAALLLEKIGIIVNKNMIPFDNISPFITSGIRMGTAACTSLGFSQKKFTSIGNLIADILTNFTHNQDNQFTYYINQVQDLINTVI